MQLTQYTDGTYLEKVKDWHVADSPWKASKVLQMIEKHHLKPKSVYDVGCGVGEILVELQRQMHPETEFCGFDISPQAISIAKKKENGKLTFCNEDFLEAQASCPGLLLLLDVFEHVPDYLGFLNRLCQMVDWIVFHIPLDIAAREVLRESDHMLYMRRKYGHLHYFTRHTALATLNDVGYDVIDWFYTDDVEISDERPKGFRTRLSYAVRDRIFRIKPHWASCFYSNFNILVLARGDRRHTT